MATSYVATGISVSLGTLNAYLLDVNHGGESADQVDVTHQASPDQWREFMNGLKDGGEVTLALLFDPDAAFPATGSQTTLAVTWPTGTTNKFSATVNVSGKGTSAPLGDKMTSDFTVKITGVPNWAAA